ncbi:MAG: hypothetical protein QY331_01105 [Melioribacteraceae bacterium]|jgi:hypothetical protein|nr:hypothetical protein [Melioribacteraceae bacterium]WKZ69848.1 MAG: hypothetical protein QY331_01105 [Melioribacteraceae bacterium]
MKLKFIIPFLFIVILSAQEETTFEDDIDRAFIHAKKGLYFALGNIPITKNSLSQDLIDNDVLIASVKLSKETNGVKVTSTGIYKTYSVDLTVYRSYDSLEKEGYRR